MALDDRGSLRDARIIWRQRSQQRRFLAAREQLFLELVELRRDIVLAVEVGIVEHLGKDVLGQDVLDQHFLHVAFGDGRVDRFLRVLEECLFGGDERLGRLALLGDQVAQRFEHRGQVLAELLHRLVEVSDLLPLVRVEADEQRVERVGIVHCDARDFVPVLDQDRGVIVGIDDVVARIAFPRLGGDLGVEIVIGVLGFPIAERHAQRVEQCAVEVDAVLLRRGDCMLGNEQQVVGAAPALEQILERLAQHAFAAAARDSA